MARETPAGRDPITDILDGLIVLRAYADTVWTTAEEFGVRLKPGAVLRDIDLAILRMAGWSCVGGPDGSTQAWVYD
jgi:hypothetical protein